MKSKCSQKTIIWLCWAVYVFAYLGRYSYKANIGLIENDFGVNHAEAGLVTTCFFFAYGIGQVVNGILCKRYNKKFLFPLVLFASSILNLVILKLPFFSFKYIWLVNGFLQSCLWSSIINVLGDTLDSDHFTKALVVMSTTATAGTIFIYGSSAFFVWLGNYRIAFVFSAIVMSLIGVIWLLLFKADPDSDINAKKEKDVSQKNDKKGISRIGIILIALAIFAVVDNLAKDGLDTWTPVILRDQYGFKDEFSILLTLILPILGTFGALLAVKLNNYIKDFVSLATVLFVVSSIFVLLINIFAGTNPVIMLVCFGIVTCTMHAINNVITAIAPLKLRDKVEPGKIAGILNGFCYLGSTLSSYGLGAVADNGGWNAVFSLLLACCIVVSVVGILFVIKRNKK